jgi:ankyrin repeat protein
MHLNWHCCLYTHRWPLHAAAANNHLSVAELLVARGADVDKLDAVSEPALWHAVEQGHGDMVSLLLKLGATASDLPSPPGKVRTSDMQAAQLTVTH